MLHPIVLLFFVHIVYSAGTNTIRILEGENKTFVYNRYKYDELIEVTLNSTTEQFLDFYEETERWHGYPSRVHVSTNSSVTPEHPLFITATQQKGIASWELPLVITTRSTVLQFDDVSRTLCPHDAGPNVTSVNRPSLQLSTSSPHNVTATIKLRRVQDFFVEVNRELNLTVKPSTPKYYYFSFDSTPRNVSVGDGWQYLPRFNYTIPKSVILMIESDDDVCATVSIQNNSCPVFDNERDVLYQGYHLTMTTKGGITLTQSMFPHGFYIVFIVRENDQECTGEALGNHGDRLKNFRFVVIATISYMEYVIGALVTLLLVLLIGAGVALLPLSRCQAKEMIILDAEGPSTSSGAAGDAPPPKQDDWDDESLSDSIPEWGGALARPLTVAGLSRATPHAHSRRDDRYFWSSLTVAVVYSLPVVQLLITYQRMVFSTGAQDLCYYNFLCAHPLGSLSDFNHVYSNVGYVVLGLWFMLQVYRRGDAETGIPQHRGVLSALGLALAMEGLLSACYHLCPNKMNFQFDSSFMYVIAVLCMVKLYQSRHADVNAGAHATFMLLAAAMAIGVIGIMYSSVYFWVAFTVLHLSTCLILTLKIYYVGQFKIERGVFSRGWQALRTHGRATFKPNYTARAVLLALANIANWALAIYGLYEHNKDFARHLLAILMGNTFLYTTFYVIMKLIHKEKMAAHTWLYLVGALACWGLAISYFLDARTKWSAQTILAILMSNTFLYTTFYVIMKLIHKEKMAAHTWLYLVGALACWGLAISYFLDARTKWSETPAQSRQHNRECSVLQFYDSHDIWHITSATAMFLYFNMLLTVDDGLKNTPRDQIPVF